MSFRSVALLGLDSIDFTTSGLMLEVSIKSLCSEQSPGRNIDCKQESNGNQA